MPCTQSEEPSAEALGHPYLRITNWCGPKSSFTNRVPSNAVCTGTSPVPPWRNVIFDGSGCKTASTTTRSCRVAFETLYATSTSSGLSRPDDANGYLAPKVKPNATH